MEMMSDFNIRGNKTANTSYRCEFEHQTSLEDQYWVCLQGGNDQIQANHFQQQTIEYILYVLVRTNTYGGAMTDASKLNKLHKAG